MNQENYNQTSNTETQESEIIIENHKFRFNNYKEVLDEFKKDVE